MRPRLIAAILALCLPPIARAHAQPEGARPVRASRVVALFDFEERLTNPLEVPQGWIRGQSDPGIDRLRDGFPRFNRAELDYEAPALQGEGTVRVEAHGGSGSLLLRPGVIPIFPGADYMAVASVRTRNATHARAVLAARLLDQSLRPIEGSESRSEPARSPNTWTRLRAPVLGDFPDAAYLQLELLLLQPDQLRPERLDDPFHIAREDFDASAWFDDVGVVALPRIQIRSESPGAVTIAPGRPSFDLLVRDLAGDALRVDAIITDATGAEIDRHTRNLPGGRLVQTWTPKLQRLGWYTATLEVRVNDVLVGSSETPFAWVPPERVPDRVGSARDARPSLVEDWEQFALMVRRVEEPVIDDLVELVRASGVGAATLGAWGWLDDQDAQNAHVARLAPAINALLDRWIRLTLSLASVPPHMATNANIELHDVITLLAAEDPVWINAAAPLIDRFGQRVRHWQLGAPLPDAPIEYPDLDADLDLISDRLSGMIPGPVIDVPWHTDDLIDPATAAWAHDLTILGVHTNDPGAFRALADDWARAAELAPMPEGADPSDRPGLTFVVDPIDPERFGPRHSAADFVRQGVMFWSAFAPTYSSEGDRPARTSLSLSDPWTVVRGRRPHAAPSPALPAMRALIDRLSGRRVTRELDNHPNIRAMLLEPTLDAGTESGGAIVLWSEGAERETFELYLGDAEITAVDIFGNHSPVDASMIPGLDIPLHRVEVTREPIFLEGVDTTLVNFLASLNLRPGMLASIADEHEATLTIENPWGVPIRGAVFIVEPGGYSDPDGDIDRSWRIAPRKVPFRLEPGAVREFPVSVAFSLAEEAGAKRVVMDVELTARRDHGVVRTEQPLEIGLPGLDLDLSVRRAIGADGVEFVAIDLIVTNSRAQPVTFDILGVAQGRPRERTAVPLLAPGEIAARTIAFEWGPDLASTRIAISLVLPDNQGRLNKSVVVD